MYAVIATGGKQYRVAPGDVLRVEKLDGSIGDAIELRPVLVVGDEGDLSLGDSLSGRTVRATITDQSRGEKLTVFTYKNKSRQHKKRGHRQSLTTIRVDEI